MVYPSVDKVYPSWWKGIKQKLETEGAINIIGTDINSIASEVEAWSVDKAVIFCKVYSFDFIASIFNSPNLSADKAASILNDANLSADKAASIIQTGKINYPKLKAILQSTNLSDSRFNEIFDALTFDYTQTALDGFTAVENRDPDGNGSVSLSPPTLTVSDGGGSYATWGHCYEKPAKTVSGSVLFISAHITFNNDADSYNVASFGVVLKDDAGNLRVITISNKSAVSAYYGYNDRPEAVYDNTQLVNLATTAGTYVFRGVYGLPFTPTEIYAVFLGIKKYNTSYDLTLESGGLKVLVLPADSPPSSVEEVRYTNA